MPRPDRLPRAAVWVVLRSRRLPAKAKLVWETDYWIDTGVDGAFISGARLAARLGLERKYVEKARAFLVRAGLHEQQAASGRRAASWFCTLPADAVPPRTGNPDDERVIACALALDRHLEAQMPPPAAAQRRDSAAARAAQLEFSAALRGGTTERGGGVGGASSSNKGTQVPSSSVVTDVGSEEEGAKHLEDEEERRAREERSTRRLRETWNRKRRELQR